MVEEWNWEEAKTIYEGNEKDTISSEKECLEIPKNQSTPKILAVENAVALEEILTNIGEMGWDGVTRTDAESRGGIYNNIGTLVGVETKGAGEVVGDGEEQQSWAEEPWPEEKDRRGEEEKREAPQTKGGIRGEAGRIWAESTDSRGRGPTG